MVDAKINDDDRKAERKMKVEEARAVLLEEAAREAKKAKDRLEFRRALRAVSEGKMSIDEATASLELRRDLRAMSEGNDDAKADVKRPGMVRAKIPKRTSTGAGRWVTYGEDDYE